MIKESRFARWQNIRRQLMALGISEGLAGDMAHIGVAMPPDQLERAMRPRLLPFVK